MKKPDKQRIWLASSCLICIILALSNTKNLEGTEFGGGWLTGRLLSMINIGTALFVLALIVAFVYLQIAAALGLVSSLLCFPLYLYLIAPVRFNQVFGFGHQLKTAPDTVFRGDGWAVAGVLILVVTGYLYVQCSRRNRSLTSGAQQLPSLCTRRFPSSLSASRTSA
jgi:hypothetical protein